MLRSLGYLGRRRRLAVAIAVTALAGMTAAVAIVLSRQGGTCGRDADPNMKREAGSAAISLLTQYGQTMALPTSLAERGKVVRDPVRVQARREKIAALFTPELVPRMTKETQHGLELVADDPTYSPYSNYSYSGEISSVQYELLSPGVEVACVELAGRDVYDGRPDTTAVEKTHVKLTRVRNTRWQVAEHYVDVTNTPHG